MMGQRTRAVVPFRNLLRPSFGVPFPGARAELRTRPGWNASTIRSKPEGNACDAEFSGIQVVRIWGCVGAFRPSDTALQNVARASKLGYEADTNDR